MDYTHEEVVRGRVEHLRIRAEQAARERDEAREDLRSARGRIKELTGQCLCHEHKIHELHDALAEAREEVERLKGLLGEALSLPTHSFAWHNLKARIADALSADR